MHILGEIAKVTALIIACAVLVAIYLARTVSASKKQGRNGKR